MRTIYKYEIDNVPGVAHVDMREGARILSAANQRERLVLWAEVDTDRRTVARRLWVAFTGDPLPGDVTAGPVGPSEFVGTVLLAGGQLVVHVYDCGEVP